MSPSASPGPAVAPTVYVVDDDRDLAASLARLLVRWGYTTKPFTDPAHLLQIYAESPVSCVVTDIMMGDLDGFTFAERLRAIDPACAIVFMTAWPSTAAAVDAVRRYGGLDYLEKPIDQDRLLAVVQEGVAWSIRRRALLSRTARLSPRERQVFALLIKGYSSKAIAAELDLSPKTVEDHRAQIAAKTGTNGLAQLIALDAG
jgi:FixJ family two-component response regulator